MTITRREMCLLLPGAMLPVGFAACAALPVDMAGGDVLPVVNAPIAGESAAKPSEQADALASGAYAFESLAPHTGANGVQTREAMKGKLATGEALETHATTLPAGVMPHPPHHHVHSEMFLVREGTLELTVNGKTYPLGPGSVGFVRSNEEHGVKNVGTAPANYFVVEMGPGAA